jgi:hypothetical protein
MVVGIIKMTELTIAKHKMTKKYRKMAEHYRKND